MTVKAEDSNGGSDTITVTINVANNITETPLTPAAPTVTATLGSTTSLDVTWTAPSNTGRPAITGYNLQYRKGTGGNFTDGPQNQTGTSASIPNLDGNSAYQVELQATNVDGDSNWSIPGSGRTANNPPTFTSTSTTRSIDETVGDATVSTAANIGAAVTATDSDNDILAYTLEGTDRDKFTIVRASGQIQTKVGEAYDYETKTSYVVTVKANDGTGSDTIAVTINVTNETEKPLTPVAPAVTTTAGSTTSLDVTWTAPSNTGRPAITGYNLQYRKGTSGNFTDGPQNQTGTSVSIPSLDANSAYQVELQATNVDGDSNWSPAGSGNTANSPPTFTSTSTTRSIDETVGDATVSTAANIGAAVTATDAEDATLTYTLEGTDKDKFTIVRASGQIQTKVGEAYDYETKTSYVVTVKAEDTGNGSDVITVTINVTNNTTETPLAPAAPTVTATSGGLRMSLDVTWTAPSNTGRPAITGYDLQYRKGMGGNFTDGPQNQTGTSASIPNLDANSAYQVEVQATNVDGDSNWSLPGSGRTVHNPPVFADDNTTRSFFETAGDATVQTAADIGAAVTVTDPDNDALTYTLDGTDKDKFTIVQASGQIQTKVGESYNYEATTSYAVTVKVDDDMGGTDTIAVTINVINVVEFDNAFVNQSGIYLYLRFVDSLSTTLPPISAIAITVDSEAAMVESVSSGGTDTLVQIEMANKIRQGQAVTASYTDPTTGNDTNAIQHVDGNDAPSFTDEPVDNQSTLTPYRPRPPTGLTATADGSTRIDLSWTAPVDNGGRVIAGYKIQFSPDGRQTGLNVIWNDVVANTNNSDTFYTETDLSPGTTRYYRVLAINSEGESEATSTATETTPTGDGTPSAPLHLRARDNGKTQIDLLWTAPDYNGDSPVTGYRIEESTDGLNNWNVLDVNTGTTDTTYEHTGLSPGTTRHYRVSAINSAGTSIASNVVSATTTPGDTPSLPNNVRAVMGDNQVILTWNAPDDNGESPIVDYEWRLGYPDPTGITFEGWNSALVNPEDTSFEKTIQGLHNESEYIFEVRATNGNGPGAAMQVRAISPGTLVDSDPRSDPPLRAWLLRFGRTVADQVLDTVADRITAGRTSGKEINLAGYRVYESMPARLGILADRMGDDGDAGYFVGSEVLAEFETENEANEAGKSRGISGLEMLTGSSFILSDGSEEDGFGSLWGRGAVSSFDGREGDLDLDGEVVSGLLGVDRKQGPSITGLMLAHSRGEGDYRGPSGNGGNGENGEIETTMTGLYPWGHHELNDRLTVWGVVGYAAGTLTLTKEGSAPIETDTDLAMASVGGRGVVRIAPEDGGLELAVKSDALMVRTTMDEASGTIETPGRLAATAAEVTRVRLAFEGTWRGIRIGDGGSFVPNFEIGVRHDGGDAETGFGSDIGAGFTWTDPSRGIQAAFHARGLLSHEDGAFRDRGVAGMFGWNSDPASDRGWSLNLAQTMGASATGGMDALLNPETARVFGIDSNTTSANDDDPDQRRLEANLGYGFGMFGGLYTGTPALGFGLSDGSREAVLGWRLAESRSSGLVFGLDLEGRRNENGGGESDHSYGFDFGWQLAGERWSVLDFGIRFEGERLEAAGEAPEHRFGIRMTARW